MIFVITRHYIQSKCRDTAMSHGERKNRQDYLELVEFLCLCETSCKGCKQMRSLINISKSKRIKRSCTQFKSKLKKRRMRIKIHGFAQLRRRWMKIMKFTSSRKFE
ncbi:hypothetical protein EJ110_NYTH39059 [Nymphaea thermarum]|nr:hypothetical protein EJ110_NYTH39059 [Nymphaea thermarum]